MTRNEMAGVVELAFRRYSKEKNKIKRGFITFEHIKLVADALFLEELTDEELGEMWNAVDKYFHKLIGVFDEKGNLIKWKPYSEDVEFAMDAASAWSEVINKEARRRKGKEQ